MKLSWVLLALAPLPAADLQAGRAAVKITPPTGAPLAGYYQHRYADGVHDDLWAKAIVLDKDGVKAALVACDLVSIERETVDAARKLIEKDTSIRADHVMISATHTHTGPQLRPRFQTGMDAAGLRIARAYAAALPLKIAEAVKLANTALAPARAAAGVGHEESISFYRRFLMKDGTVRFNPGKMNPEIVQPMGLIDPDAAVVTLDSLEGVRLATYVNFALHLDTVGGTQFSADYPFTLAKLLGKLHGPEMLTLFTIGAAGNINHVDVKSRDPQKGHGEAKRIGTILAGEVLKTTARLDVLVPGPLMARTEIVPLPLPVFTAVEVDEARTLAAQFGKPGMPFLDMVQALKVVDIADRKDRPWDAEVQVIALGPGVAWVGLPGEIFVELGTAIKKASPFPVTIVVGLANDSLSYVPTHKAFTEGAYEVISARCAAGGGEAVADTAIRLLAELSRAQRAR